MSLKIFKDKVAVVTGAASGIGKALSELLLQEGALVILIDNNQELLSKNASMLGDEAIPKFCDVTNQEAVQGVVDYAVQKYGRIDYIFNNAGIVIAGEARDITARDWQKVLNINTNGVINGVAAAYPVMVKQGFGHIVNTASMAGLAPMVFLASYSTSKYAVVGLSHTLRIEGRGLGVKVSVVCPSLIDTPIFKNSVIISTKIKTPLDALRVSGWSPKSLTAEKAARIILDGVAKNKSTILMNFSSRLLWYIYRLSPDLWMRLTEIYIKRIRDYKGNAS